jgi:DNA repair protein RadC
MQRLFSPEIPVDSEPPLARLWRRGSRSLCDTELVSMLVAPGCSEAAAQEMARKVLGGSGLAGLLRLEEKNFLSQRGLALRPAAAVLAALELGRRMAWVRVPERRLMERPDLVAGYLWLRYHQRDQEVAGAMYLDARMGLIEIRELVRGTLCRAVVEPRTFLRPALENGAWGMVMFHTHPSGDPAPSADDLTFTHRLDKAGEIVGIQLIDHLILGSSRLFVSLSRRGWPCRKGRRILPESQISNPGGHAGQKGVRRPC